MIRKAILITFVVALLCSCGMAQDEPAPYVFSVFGTFEHVPQGWKCRNVGSSVPALLGDLHVDDVLVSIDHQDLRKATAISLLQQLRTIEFGLADEVDAVRAGLLLKWTAPASTPQIIASQNSAIVLRSTVGGVRPGDVLNAIGEASFAALMGQVANPLTSVVNVEVHPGRGLGLTRDGHPMQVTAESRAVVRLVNFDLTLGQEVPEDAVLHGLNTSNVTIGSLRGRWVLLHFWATWCVPCLHHLPDMRELAQRKDLFVAAIGFADTNERLAAAGASEKDLKIFAPSLNLQRQLAVVGIPFDVLLDPEGKAVFVVSGDIPGDKFKEIVAQYVGAGK